MNKSAGKNIKKAVAAVVLAAAGIAVIIAESGRKTVWGDSLGEGSRESAGTAEWNPSRYAYDGDVETYWQPEEGREESWFEYYTEEERSISGCELESEIPEKTRLSIYYEKNGTWIPVENGCIEGPFSGKETIKFKDSLYDTKRMLVKVAGEDCSESKIREIEWKIRENKQSYMKIQPASYSFNQEEYINLKPERLWNGSVNSTWYEPVWYIPWEISNGRSGAEGIFAPYFGNPPEEGEIIWELDGPYEIETVKAYFSQSYRCIGFEFWDGNGWSGKTVISGNSENGWKRAEVNYSGRTERIRITFPYGWEMAKYINQIEVWGNGENKNYERGAVFSERNGKVYFSGENLKGKKYETTAVKNGKVISKKTIKDYELRKGNHYFELETGSVPDGVVIREYRNDGRIKTEDRLDDGNLSGSEEEYERHISLDREYEIEKVRIYGKGLENAAVRTGNFDVYEPENGDGYWDVNFRGKKASEIIIESDYGFILDEVKIYGSPLTDDNVEVEIWTKEEIRGNEDCIIGWMGNVSSQPLIDEEYNPRQMDNVFWMPVKECGGLKKDYREYKVTCSLDGKTTVRRDVIRKEGSAEYDDGERGYGTELITIDLPNGDIYTQRSEVRVSGKYGNAEQLKILVNGQEADICENNVYCAYVKLLEGENAVTVTAETSDGRKDSKSIKVFSDTESPEIEILYPHEGEYIPSEYVTVSANGKKDKNLWWKINDEPWESGPGYVKNKTYRLEDNFYTYTVTAQDRSGNVSETESVSFCVDITPPLPCKLTIEEPPYSRYNWTNNKTPVITYSTSDATSGVASYEYKVDESGVWTVIETETPGEFRMPPLSDGKHRIYVRGRDRAGNACEDDSINSYVVCNVDTTVPSAPRNLKAVGGKDFITIRWESANSNPFDAEDFHDFIITRTYNGRIEYIEVNGNKLDRNHEEKEFRIYDRDFGENTYKDSGDGSSGLQAGDKYIYSIKAIDRAGNTSAPVETEGIAGVSIGKVESEKPTVIEYDNVVLTIPENVLDPSIVSIIINECPVEEAAVIPENPVLSHIFRVLQVRQKKNADGRVEEFVTEHANLDGYASFDIRYDNPPEEWEDAEIRPYYYDDIYGTWLLERRAVTDRKNRTVHFKVNHFCDFTVQATEESILTPEQMRSGAYSPMDSEIGQGVINVSSEGGDVSTEFTETRVPGKSGFDFVVQRVYTNGYAVKDAKKVAKKKDEGREIKLNGDEAWKAGKGWRINVPSLTWNGSEIWVKDFNGATVALSQSSGAAETSSSSSTEWKWYGGNKTDKTSFITFTSHEYTDIKVDLRLSSVTKRWLFFSAGTSYSLDGAVLYQKDGKTVEFDSNGRVLKITDAAGFSSIDFEYSDEGNKVTTSLGKSLYFQKKGEYITEIRELRENGRKVSYTQEDDNLTKAIDFGGREWIYTYEQHDLENDSSLVSVDGKKQEENNSSDDSKTVKEVQALKSVSGPGYGTWKVEYAPMPFRYKDTFKSGNSECEYEISYKELKANKVVQDEKKEISYSTSFVKGKDTPWQFVPEEATIKDGLVTTRIEYAKATKDTYRFSQAPDFMKRMSRVEGIGENEKEKKTVTYPKKIVRSADNRVYEVEENEYSTDLMRVTKNRVTRTSDTEKTDTENYRQTEFSYDSNGNITAEVTVTRFKNIWSAVRTERTFVNPKDYMYVPEKVTVSDYGSESVENPKYIELDISKQKGNDLSDGKISETRTVYEYNDKGQLISKTLNYVQKYEYTYADSDLASETSPEGAETGYEYDYAKFDSYIITKTVKQKDAADDDKKTSLQEISKWSGKVLSETDRDGYTTEYEYDGLNRVTLQKKYTKETPVSETSISVSYSDSKDALSSTVINENGVETQNSFDRYGRLVKTVQDTKGQKKTTELEYDDFDRVVKVKGPYLGGESLGTRKEVAENYVTGYEYDGRSRIIKTTNPEGKAKTVVYNESEGETVTTDETGRKTRSVSDINGNVLEVSRWNSEWKVNETTRYSGSGKTIRKVDGNGNVISISYNELGLEAEIELKDSGNRKVSKKSMEYDKDGRLRKETSQVSENKTVKTEYTYNYDGTVETRTVPLSDRKHVTSYTYDGRGNVLSETSGYVANPGAEKEISEVIHTKSYTYDFRGNVKTETDENGYVTSYEYDSCGNRIKVTDPREGSTEKEYSGSSYFISMEYDSLNRLVKAWIPKDSGKTDVKGTPDIIIEYDGRGHVTERTDPGNIKTVNAYKKAGYLESQAVGELKTVYEYDDSGRKIKETGPDGEVTEYGYDSFGRLSNESNTDGSIVYTYYGNDALRTLTDRNGNVTFREYNALGQVESEEVSEGPSVVKKMSYEYDMTGRQTKQTDGTGNTLVYDYDELGRIVRETRNYGDKKSQNYDYDAWGNVIKFTDYNGTVFSRTYTAVNLLSDETAVNGTRKETLSYTYDIAGNVKTVTNKGGTVSYNLDEDGNFVSSPYGNILGMKWTATGLYASYEYDEANRLKKVSYNGTEVSEYSYDSSGRLTSQKGKMNVVNTWEEALLEKAAYDGVLSQNLTYDSLSRIQELSYSGKALQSWKYGYDSNGNIISMTENQNLVSRYSYDAGNQLLSAEEAGDFESRYDNGNAATGIIEEDYDGNLMPTFTSSVDVKVTEVSFDKGAQSLVYNLQENKKINALELYAVGKTHRVSEKNTRIFVKGSGEKTQWVQLKDFKYKKDEANGSLHFELKEAVEACYVKINTLWNDRDIDWNVVDRGTFRNKPLNMLRITVMESRHNERYEYDLSGNRVNGIEYYQNDDGGNTSLRKTDGIWTYEYDANGNRISKKSVNGKESWTYRWDLHNRLIEVMQKDPEDRGTPVHVLYEYDGLNYRIARTRTDGVKTEYAYGRNGAVIVERTGGITRSYIYANGVIAGFVDSDGVTSETRYCVTDHQGSVEKIVDEKGSVLWEGCYTAFGVKGGEIVNRIEFTGMFTGKDIDPETGLTYHWNRWRSEDGSVWLTQDPARDGLNWYGYAGQNPVNFIDPLGLYPRKPTPLMGVQAHKSIIQQLKSQDLENGIIAGPQIYLPNPDGGKKGGFFVDYSRKDSEGNKEFYEIKPISYMKNQRGDKQLEKYIDRDGKAVKGMELMSTIQNMEPIETIMSTPLGNEKISIQLTVDPVNHPGMIFYELDDGRTPKEEALKVAEKIIVPVINAALIVIGAGVEIPQMPTVPEPVPVLP